MLANEKARILLVDDRPENLTALEAVLADMGHTLVRAASGREALKRVLEQDFAVILLDVQMPDLDGFETAQLIRERDRSRHTPIVFLTAYGKTDAQVRRGYSAGAIDYVVKPFEPEILKAKMTAFVDLWNRSHALEVETGQRRQAEEAARRQNEELERRVAQRTAALEAANADLRREIEERRRVEADLERARDEAEENYRRLKALEELRDDLSDMVVHDLRTPLAATITAVQTVKILGPINGEQEEVLDLAVRSGHTLLGMIGDMLDISKMEAGSLQLQEEVLDARLVVEGAIQQIAPLAELKQLSLEHELDPDLPRFPGDREKLARVLVNLLGNAIRHTPQGGSITVSTRLDPGEQAIVFSVRDTGEGIPKEAFARIFEKFGQVESRKAGQRGSTGLGLTFCRLAIEAHGGRIWVESEPGQGSTFSFTIPLNRAARGDGARSGTGTAAG